MKRISKILSVLMVAVMLFSISAVPASAWDVDSSTTVKYVFKDADGKEITKANKGDFVYLHVVLNWNKNVFGFQGTFKFEKEAITLYHKTQNKVPTSLAQAATYIGDFAKNTEIGYDEMTPEQQEFDDNNNGLGVCATYGAGKKDGHYNANISAWDAETKAKYQAITVIFASSTDENTQQLIVNTNGEDLDYCKFRFLVNEDTDLTKVVLTNDDAFSAMNSIDIPDDQDQLFANFATFCTTYVPAFEYGSLDIVTPALDPVVTHIGTMGQMKNWKNHEFPFNAGLVGQISNLPLTFDGNNHSVELEKIEVSIKTAAGTTVAQAYTVYKVDDTTWKFRAVIPNLDAEKVANTDNMECQYTIYVDDDNNDETPAKEYSSDVFNTNLKAIYDLSCSKYPG